MRRAREFFSGCSFVPYVSFVIKRTGFIGWKVKERTIEDHELVLISEGEGELKSRGANLPCRTGTLLYLHEGYWHSIEADPRRPITFYSVHFSFARARHTPESWCYHKEINYYLKDCRARGRVWSFDTRASLLPFSHAYEVGDFPRVEKCFIALNRTYREKRIGYELRLNALLLDLLDVLFNESAFPPDKASNIDTLELAMRYIHEHHRQTIRNEHLVQHLGISESRLIRLFKKNTGKTPIEYVNQVKINHAKDLLSNTAKTVKETAFELGFRDEFYFSRLFKKLEGSSPRNYRTKI